MSSEANDWRTRGLADQSEVEDRHGDKMGSLLRGRSLRCPAQECKVMMKVKTARCQGMAPTLKKQFKA